MGSRVKKYRMKAIPSAFSEKGGFSAQFIGDGYSVDARTEILPSVITASGVQVGEGTAWELVTAFLKACAQRAANTGETVNVGSLVTFGLAIKGWYSNKDSKAAKDSVRVTATLLGDLKPTVAFSMSNALEGATLVLVTVMSDGCALGHVRQGAAFRINGKELVMLEGDTVTATLKTEGGETVTALCPISGSASDHIDATLPAVFSDAAFAGREVRFTVKSLRLDSVLSVGFEKIFLMQNPSNESVSEVISTYTYKMGLQSMQYSFSTAVNLMNTLVNFVMLFLVNFIARKTSEYSLW